MIIEPLREVSGKGSTSLVRSIRSRNSVHRPSRASSVLVVLTAALVFFWAPSFGEETNPGPQRSRAAPGGQPRTTVAHADRGEVLEAEGEERPLEGRSSTLPPMSAQKRTLDGASSGWVGDVFLRISGNESFPNHQILGTLTLPRSNDGRQLGRTIEGHIRSFYRDAGFARVRVTAALSASEPFIFDAEIREGRVLFYAGLELEGINAVPHAQVAALYPEPGGLVDWNRIRDANFALRQKYHDMGFASVIISGKGIVSPLSSQLRYRVRVVERRPSGARRPAGRPLDPTNSVLLGPTGVLK